MTTINHQLTDESATFSLVNDGSFSISTARSLVEKIVNEMELEQRRRWGEDIGNGDGALIVVEGLVMVSSG